ncbi:MAG: DNA-binding response regulator, partial [Tannerella sp.]|nr:DNA-binding response regulator [Tannerella sp.]
LSPRYQVYDASNGQEALEIALELIPDMVVSDVMMPVMDGITFCHKLKNDMRISHIPVILLTARTPADSIIEGFESGADEYLTKPFNERVLLARINNILQSRQEIRERVRREMILNPQEVSLNTQDGIFLSKFVAYIEDHIGETDFNIIQMATEMAMSHSNLYKKVKALTGMSVISFVKEFRLKRAAQLLVQNELHITEIAYMTGYSERRHFSQDFKRKFDLTPKEYIEKHKNSKT